MGRRGRSPGGSPVDGARALTELLQGLVRESPGPVSDAIVAEVGRLRALAIRPRERPTTERERILQAIDDADATYQAARGAVSHQAADRALRHKQDLEAELRELDKPEGPTRATTRTADPTAGRIEFLEVHLAEVEADLVYLRTTGQWTLIPPLDARAVAIRDEIDEARGAAGVLTALNRSPGELATQILEHIDEIRELAEAERLAREADPLARASK